MTQSRLQKWGERAVMIGLYIYIMYGLYVAYPIIKNNPDTALASADAALPYPLIDMSFVLAAILFTLIWLVSWAVVSYVDD